MKDIEDDLDVTCLFDDLSNNNLNVQMSFILMHMNVRSLRYKICKFEGLLNVFGYPKAFVVSETWLNESNVVPNIPNYVFLPLTGLSV